jgi:Fe2+ or Zn2+ uptake regulation protein
VPADYADLLRRRGLHVTAQRLAVLRVVALHPHATADVVRTAVQMEIGSISLQSVYDVLAALAKGGLIRRIEPAGSPARFEDRVGDNHHHAICRTCGRMVDVNCATGLAPCLTAGDAHGFEIDEAEVIYWGRCPRCRSSASRLPTRPDSASKPHRTKRRVTPGRAPTHPR